tara:strand:+ start:40 stop:786 length:747 start_codon:yes stop_codon:yes gene_type:complete
MGYFTKTIDCEIPGSRQHVAAFAAGDLLFDWTGFEIPKGGAKLVGATALIRGKGDANATGNTFGFSLLFGRVGATIGTANAVAFLTGKITKDIYGSLEMEAADFMGTATANGSLSVATTGGNKASSIVLTGDPLTPTSDTVGYDKFYVAGVAQGAFDFITLNRINDGDIDSASPGTTLVTDGSGMDIREQIMVGDELVTHDDAAIGTVASLTSTTSTELTAALATGILEDDDFVYVKHPITLQLHFEK